MLEGLKLFFKRETYDTELEIDNDTNILPNVFKI
jgi:hypothetical protein